MSFGPISHSTVVCKNLDRLVSFYRKFGARVDLSHMINPEQSKALFGEKANQIRRSALISSETEKHIVLAVEIPKSVESNCLHNRGWMALEISTNAVDYLGDYLKDEKIHGAPKNLDFSDKIRAMQVEGKANEMLYLTQISGAVPPFALPQPTSVFDSLFIVILSSHDRQLSATFYSDLSKSKPILAETKITVINRAFNLPISTKHPIAVVQCANESLIEIDQINESHNLPKSDAIYTGIHAVSFFVDDVKEISAKFNTNSVKIYKESIYNGDACILIGPDREIIECIKEEK